jgi:hypothetical protein
MASKPHAASFQAATPSLQPTLGLRLALKKCSLELCPVKGCRWYIKEDNLMCAYHWRHVQKSLAIAILRWSRFNRGAPEYKDLCAEALQPSSR